MEDVLSTINEKELKQLMFISMIENNQKIQGMIEKLRGDPSKLIDKSQKEKYEKTLKEAKTEYENFEKEIDTQLKKRNPIRIYVDGVFDIIHSGHFNAIRQSKKLGEVLVLGVNSDEDVLKAKGPTLMNIEERGILAGSTKWSDEVALKTPYTPDLKTLEKYNCDYLSHGDDLPSNENGETIYDNLIKLNKLRIFKRTEGISTTDITGRLLLSAKDRVDALDSKDEKNADFIKKYQELESLTIGKNTVMKSLLTTSWRISEFSNKKLPKKDDKIVYFCGDFDVLQRGHVEALKLAKQQGDFLYVGIFGDNTIKQYRGKYFPILNLNERTLNVLALKNVDEVIIDTPAKITEDMIKFLNAKVVVRFISKRKENEKIQKFKEDLYEIPKKLGILKEIEIEYDLSNEELVDRIWNRKEDYLNKYLNKIKKEIVSMGNNISQI